MPNNIMYLTYNKIKDSFGHLQDIKLKVIYGKEDAILKVLKKHNPTQSANTSYIERSNLNRRLFNARLRRKTLAYSKNYDCLTAQLNLQRVYSNFCWKHHTLTKQFGQPTSPAMAINATNRILSCKDVFSYAVGH